MQFQVKKMKNMRNRGISCLSRNLQLGGIALALTSGLVAIAKPENITILFAPFTGNPLVLGRVLFLMGSLTALLGYALRDEIIE